jgi:hypothetical protein
MAQVARLDWLAKLGFLARAVVYVLLGYIALNTRGKADEGQNAVFESLRDMPAGSIILTLTALGLLAYGLFRLIGAVIDIDGEGNDAKGWVKRAGQVISGLGHALLAYTAWQFTSQMKQSEGSGNQGSQKAAETLFDLPLGEILLGIVGLYFFVTAASQAMKAATASFMREIAPSAPHYTRMLGQAGHAARAVVFAIIGWSIVRAAWFHDQGEAKAVGGALASLRDNALLYALVAVGLITFGLFSFILARYRIVPQVDVVQAARSKLR